MDQPSEQAEVRVGGEQNVEPSARLQPRMRLREQFCDVAVARPRDPRRSGVARLARKGWRTRQDQVEERPLRQGGEEVGQSGTTRPANPFSRALSAAESAAFGLMSMAITRAAPARAAASDRTPEPVPISATVSPFQVEPVDEARKILAGEEKAGVEHGRPHNQAEAGGTGLPRALACEDEVIGEEMDEVAQPAPGEAVGDAWTG